MSLTTPTATKQVLSTPLVRCCPSRLLQVCWTVTGFSHTSLILRTRISDMGFFESGKILDGYLSAHSLRFLDLSRIAGHNGAFQDQRQKIQLS